jgi:hypothetical protein
MAGLEYARAYGTKSGRPIGRPKRIFDREEAIKLSQRGMSVRAIAEHLKIGSGTVVRALKSLAVGSEQPTPSETVAAPILLMPKPAPRIWNNSHRYKAAFIHFIRETVTPKLSFAPRKEIVLASQQRAATSCCTDLWVFQSRAYKSTVASPSSTSLVARRAWSGFRRHETSQSENLLTNRVRITLLGTRMNGLTLTFTCHGERAGELAYLLKRAISRSVRTEPKGRRVRHVLNLHSGNRCFQSWRVSERRQILHRLELHDREIPLTGREVFLA